MLKKITNFLFKDEEIIEEELIEKPEKVQPVIQKVEPIKIQEPVVSEPVQEAVKPKKSIMIDLEEPIRREERAPTPTHTDTPYVPRKIISPIYGGPDLPDTPVVETPVVAKSRQPLTRVISPMYGAVGGSAQEVEAQMDVYEMGLEDLIKPEFESEDDVQVSLFDILGEGSVDDE